MTSRTLQAKRKSIQYGLFSVSDYRKPVIDSNDVEVLIIHIVFSLDIAIPSSLVDSGVSPSKSEIPHRQIMGRGCPAL